MAIPKTALWMLLCAASPSVGAADDDPTFAKAPYLEVGDCWSYRASGLYHHGWITEYRECVTHIDKEKNLVLALATVRDDGREIETSYSLEWGENTPIDGRYNTPSAGFLKFPLRVGNKYKLDFTIRNSAGFGQFLPASYEMEVVRWEDVSVPAGKFRTLRIEGRGIIQGMVQISSHFRVIWYAPDINRAVKWSFSLTQRAGPVPDDRFEVELTKYELNK